MITFCEYMDRMLYGPAGYYASGAAQSGKAGDYFTAPDVGPAMGRLLTEIFLDWKAKLKADDFCLIEVGAGEGRLAVDILSSFRRKPESSPANALDPGFRRGDGEIKYLAIERSLARRKHLEKIQKPWPNFEVHPDLASLKTNSLQGVLFGNELIDAFPVNRVRSNRGKLQELFIDENSPAHSRLIWGAPSTPKLEAYFSRLNISLPDGYETEVNLAMAGWLKEAAGALEKGLLVLIDYGRPAHEYYAPERTRGTLRAFSKHKVVDPFASSPAATGGGSMGPRQRHSGATSLDWTSDVDFTSLALDGRRAGFTPLAFMEMGTFLMQGLERAMKDEGRGTRDEGREKAEEKRAIKHIPPGDSDIASSLFAHRSSLKYLLHPEGLGTAFHVLILGKGIDPSKWVFEHNRLSRLGL